MYDDRVSFLMSFFNFSTAFLSAVIIAWTRHGFETDTIREPSKVEKVLYRLTDDLPELLSQDEKSALLKMMDDGYGLTFQNAARYGMTRATWNRVRSNLVKLGLAEYRDGGRLQARANMRDYLEVVPHRDEMSQNSAGGGVYTSYVDLDHYSVGGMQ